MASCRQTAEYCEEMTGTTGRPAAGRPFVSRAPWRQATRWVEGLAQAGGLCAVVVAAAEGFLLQAASAHANEPPARAPARLWPIDPRRVRIGGEIGRRIDITIRKNLFAIDIDGDFLEPFRRKDRRPGSYVGLGKLIDAAARLAYHTGDKRLVALKERLVRQTVRTQLSDGYIGVFPARRLDVLWDVHELSYVIFGLVSDYRHFGSREALAAARRAADYMMRGRPGGFVFHVSTIGLERAFLALHEATQERKYLDYATKDGALRDWHDPIGGHAYDYMSVCLAQLDLYRIRPDQNLLRQARRVLDFLTAGEGLVISGTCSRQEAWHSDQAGTGRLGETCCTAYLIRLLDHLLRVEGQSLCGDIMERAIYNALFAAQSPDGRELRKYTPFEGKRLYYRGEQASAFQRDTYCCPNNFRRIVAELPGMIYYRWGGGVAVNLYAQSEAAVRLDGGLEVKLRQQTDYPNSGKVTVHLTPSKPAELALRLRIPRWCPAARIAVNGQPVRPSVKGGRFHTLRRRWQAGDRVDLHMPMSWRLVRGRRAQRGRAAVMRGPVLFCLNPARQPKGLPTAKTGLKDIRCDPASLEGPVRDEAVRPSGLAVRLRAWSPGGDRKRPPDLTLLLTEFPDPGGEMTYFVVSDPTVRTAEDELRR